MTGKMKKKLLLHVIVVLSILLFSCRKSDYFTKSGSTTITDNGSGTGTVTWTSDKTYFLDGLVFVNDGQTLTIEPGTIIKAKTGQGESASALIVAYPDPTAVITTVKLAQLINPEIPILARASRKNEIEKLKQLGVKELIIPEREAGYKFVKALFNLIGLEREERKHLLAIIRNAISK